MRRDVKRLIGMKTRLTWRRRSWLAVGLVLTSHITYPTVVMFRSILMNNSCEIEVFRFVLLMKKVQLGISFKNFAGFGKSLQFN